MAAGELVSTAARAGAASSLRLRCEGGTSPLRGRGVGAASLLLLRCVGGASPWCGRGVIQVAA